MKTGYEILVVDDNLQAAKEVARLINLQTRLEAVATDDPEEAVTILKENPIKVALLDQRMPKKDGTALFKDLRRVDSSVRAIMLTGEADANEVGDALNLGFPITSTKAQLRR